MTDRQTDRDATQSVTKDRIYVRSTAMWPNVVVNQATGYASQHIWCLSQARIIGRVMAGRASGIANGV